MQDLHSAATDFFNGLDTAIIECEVLGRKRPEVWAQDLANTAVNVLENIPQCYQSMWEEADRLKRHRPNRAETHLAQCKVL